jgi:polyisoprenyl-phosphate glycosyltransferase
MNELKKKLISIVIPAKNEEKNIIDLKDRLDRITNNLLQYDFEFLLVDNHSEDSTEELLNNITQNDNRWKYIRFSRDFFLDASLSAGLHFSKGDAVIILFSDLQDPPELIPKMISLWEEGNDIVYGLIQKRDDHNFIKKIGSIYAHKIINHLSKNIIPKNAADFQLLSRRVVNTYNKYGESNRYFRGLIHWAGFKKTPLAYNRSPRIHGKTTSKVFYATKVAMEGITSFSQTPLKFATIFGLIITTLSILGMILYLILKIFNLWIVTPPLGSTTIVFLILFFGGTQSMFLGIIGEYIGKIYIEVKDRPLWVIEKTIGIETKTE